MPTEYTSSGTPNLIATIPALTDNASIVDAFEDYHDDIGLAIGSKANLSGATFTGAISSTGTVTANGGTITTNNVTLIGQANAAIAAGRYISGTGSANVLSNTSSAVRIWISQANPNACTTALTTGDIWISWT
jgi:hypothetical protein